MIACDQGDVHLTTIDQLNESQPCVGHVIKTEIQVINIEPFYKEPTRCNVQVLLNYFQSAKCAVYLVNY